MRQLPQWSRSRRGFLLALVGVVGAALPAGLIPREINPVADEVRILCPITRARLEGRDPLDPDTIRREWLRVPREAAPRSLFARLLEERWLR